MPEIALPYDALDAPEQLDVELLEPLVKDLGGGDAREFEYQLNWFAAVLQRRGEKLSKMLVYAGGNGVGKDILVTTLMGRVFGPSFQIALGAAQRIEDSSDTGAAGDTLLCVVEDLGAGEAPCENDLFTPVVAQSHHKDTKTDTRNFCATTNDGSGFRVDRDDCYVLRASDEWGVNQGRHTKDEQCRHFARVLGARYGADVPARPARDEEIELVARQLYGSSCAGTFRPLSPGTYCATTTAQSPERESSDSAPSPVPLWRQCRPVPPRPEVRSRDEAYNTFFLSL